jgi:hypothetical protein
MNADRKTMEAGLKAACVPRLREMGFKGSFPNFFRETDGFVSLVSFQFFSAGGSFCVNLGYADPQRKNVYFQPDTEVQKLRVNQTRETVRLGAVDGGDCWFSFGETSYGEFRGQPRPVGDLAAICNELLASDAETWWRSRQTSRASGDLPGS